MSIPKDCILSITVFYVAMVLTKRKRERELEKAVNVSLFTVRRVVVGFVEGVESGIQNAEFAIDFLFLFVENHFAFTIFFSFSFLKL